jgi:hypothetical protein
MKTSETIGKLAAALAKAQPKFGSAIKDANNTFLNSKYADLNAVWNAVKDVLPEYGLSIVQAFEPMPDTSICLETILLHESGEYISGSIVIPFSSDAKNPAQAAGSAATYARRYGLAAILGIVTEDDDGHGGGAQEKQTTNRARNTSANKPTQKPTNTPVEKTSAPAAGSKIFVGLAKKREAELVELCKTLNQLGDEPFDDKKWSGPNLDAFSQDRFDKPLGKLDAEEMETLIVELQGRIDEANERAAIQEDSGTGRPPAKVPDTAETEPMITEAQATTIKKLCDIKDREVEDVCLTASDQATSSIDKLTKAEAEKAIKLLNAAKK